MKIPLSSVITLCFCLISQTIQANPLNFWKKSKVALDASLLNNIVQNQQLLIEGTNQSKTNRILVVRVDDTAFPNYANRVNLERSVPPGPFKFRINLDGLHTSNHRPINLNKLQSIKVFQGDGSTDLDFLPLKLLSPLPFKPSTMAWDFGPQSSALFSGFKPLDSSSAYIKGSLLSEVFRGKRSQAYDALTSDGIKGIQQLFVPLPKGRWYLTLWIKEPGEWEYLPHPLHKKFIANNQTVYEQKYTGKKWVEEVYLEKEKLEASPTSTPWQLYGHEKNGRISFPVDVSNDGLTLRFEGEQPNGSYLSALIAEKTPSYSERAKVEAQRKEWWNETWRVAPWTSLEKHNQGKQHEEKSAIPGTLLHYWVDVDKDFSHKGFSYALSDFNAQGIKLKPSIRYAQWRLERKALSSTLLTPSNSYLKSPTAKFIPATDAPFRRLHIEIKIPKGLGKLGQAKLNAKLKLKTTDGKKKEILLTANIVPLSLPEAEIPIGVYLEKPIHLSWFHELKEQTNKAFKCDLTLLKSLGFSGISPPFATPKDKASIQQFLIEYEQVYQSGFQLRHLAYAPYKRLQKSLGLADAAKQIAEIDRTLEKYNHKPIVWSIADEPSNAGESQSPEEIARYIRAFSPKSLLAGHLNTPEDRARLKAFDIVLINNGYGADKSDIDDLKQKSLEPWFYNLDAKRIFSGFYLWKTGAKGFMQWHARMPTADPFNPTDGREGDAQFIYPSSETCPSVMPINKSLIDLSEGVIDYRLIQLLSKKAIKDAKLKKVLISIENELPSQYQEALNISENQMNSWRQKIISALEINKLTY